MKNKIVFKSRQVLYLMFDAGLGPEEGDSNKIEYGLFVSDPKLNDENEVEIVVEAKINACDGEAEGSPPGEGRNFLRAKVLITFGADKLTAAEKKKLPGMKDYFTVYARNIAAEVISTVIPLTRYVIHSVPR